MVISIAVIWLYFSRRAMRYFSLKCMLENRLFRYVIVGFVNTSICYSVYCLFIYFGWSITIASFFSLMSGVFVGYLGHSHYVFGLSGPMIFQRFIYSWFMMFVVYIVVSYSMAEYGSGPYVAGAVATISNVVLSYIVLKSRVFV